MTTIITKDLGAQVPAERLAELLRAQGENSELVRGIAQYAREASVGSAVRAAELAATDAEGVAFQLGASRAWAECVEAVLAMAAA